MIHLDLGLLSLVVLVTVHGVGAPVSPPPPIINLPGQSMVDEGVTLKMSPSTADAIVEHTHFITLSGQESRRLRAGFGLNKQTSTNAGHSHELNIRYSYRPINGHYYYYQRCDNMSWTCWDGHPRQLHVV